MLNARTLRLVDV